MSPRLYSDEVRLFDGSLSDYKGGPRAHAALPDIQHSDVGPGSTVTTAIAARLRTIGCHRIAARLEECARGSWRCEQANFCGRCGRRAAIRERIAIEKEIRSSDLPRALITRTIAPTGDISRDRGILLEARRAQLRSRVWRRAVQYTRGRVEIAFGPAGPMVHAHEIALLAEEPDVEELARSWRRLLAAEGAAGSIDVQRRAKEGAPGRATFRSARLLRDKETTKRTARSHE